MSIWKQRRCALDFLFYIKCNHQKTQTINMSGTKVWFLCSADACIYLLDCRSIVYHLNIKWCIQPVAITHQYVMLCCSSCGHYDWPKGSVLCKSFYSRHASLFCSCQFFLFIDLIMWLHSDHLYKFNYNVLIILTTHLAVRLSDQFVGSNANHKKKKMFSLSVCNSNHLRASVMEVWSTVSKGRGRAAACGRWCDYLWALHLYIHALYLCRVHVQHYYMFQEVYGCILSMCNYEGNW